MNASLTFITASEIACNHDCDHADTVTENGIVRCHGCTCQAVARTVIEGGTFPHTADEYREKARACRQRSADSWERSDTDGFLSQWASDKMASRYDHLAEVVENGGVIEHLALFLNGKFVSAHQGSGQWGLWWRLNDEGAAAHGKAFFSPSKAKKATEADRKKGFTYGTIRVAAFVDKSDIVRPNYEDLSEGRFEILATDGAYDGIDEMFIQD